MNCMGRVGTRTQGGWDPRIGVIATLFYYLSSMVSTNFKYDYHCWAAKKIGLIIWKDFYSAVKVCNIRFELLVVKPISTIQIDEGSMLCVRKVCRFYDNTYFKV